LTFSFRFLTPLECQETLKEALELRGGGRRH
jgi:hypothetical protein